MHVGTTAWHQACQLDTALELEAEYETNTNIISTGNHFLAYPSARLDGFSDTVGSEPKHVVHARRHRTMLAVPRWLNDTVSEC